MPLNSRALTSTARLARARGALLSSAPHKKGRFPMGRLSKFMGQKPAKAPTDDVLLLHAIVCMAAADGDIEDAESEMIRNYANTLPEFRDMDGGDWEKCMSAQHKIIHKYNKDMKSSLQALNEIQSDVVRRK